MLHEANRSTWNKQVGTVLGSAVLGEDAEGVEALVVLGQVRQRQTGHSSTHRHVHQFTGFQQFICTQSGRHSDEGSNVVVKIYKIILDPR